MHVEDVASDDNGQDLRCGKHGDALNISTPSICTTLSAEERKMRTLAVYCLLLEESKANVTDPDMC